ncbi:MAG: ATP-binding protein [[Clostridium] scindens]
MINLLSNALKFTPKAAKWSWRLTVTRERKNRVRLRFTVKDTGIGMTPEFMERLFQPFEQETDVTIRKVKVPDWECLLPRI